MGRHGAALLIPAIYLFIKNRFSIWSIFSVTLEEAVILRKRAHPEGDKEAALLIPTVY